MNLKNVVYKFYLYFFHLFFKRKAEFVKQNKSHVKFFKRKRKYLKGVQKFLKQKTKTFSQKFEYTGVLESTGYIKYYVNGLLDREDGPASIMPECNIYYKNGKKHREDGAAFHNIKTNFKLYYLNDKLYSNIKTDEEWFDFLNKFKESKNEYI